MNAQTGLAGAPSAAAARSWTRGEMMAVAGSHQVRDEDVVLVGLGLPQVAALLARHTHAAGVSLLLEAGIFGTAPREPAMGVADPRMWAGATAFGSLLEVLGAMLHGGRVTLGLLGALQVDRWGSINTTQVPTARGGIRRFNGSGGGNDVSSHAGRTVIIMAHEPRKFASRLDFVTSPGRKVGDKDRAELGLSGGGPSEIVTDRAVISLGPEGPVLAAVHPGEDPELVARDTPIPLLMPSGGPVVTPPPTERELSLIRSELDPLGWYTR
jgi:glutaconate CoA-transferase subunit B